MRWGAGACTAAALRACRGGCVYGGDVYTYVGWPATCICSGPRPQFVQSLGCVPAGLNTLQGPTMQARGIMQTAILSVSNCVLA
jgi:hypothetical protein